MAAKSPGPRPTRARLATDGVASVDAAAWNRLVDGATPYLRHEFLAALETENCLGEWVGWLPRPLLLEAEDGGLLGALPLYVKLNSFGEFVFDGAWAEAHARQGLSYFPKLVVACPFTPATGSRLLLRPDCRAIGLAARLIDAALDIARELGVSSLHWLFATDASLGGDPRLLPRLGCQFHWTNAGYADFEDFLGRLTAKRRKEILRERRKVREAGVELIRLAGGEVSAREWRLFHDLYRATFDKHGNYPALTAGFFRQVAAAMGEHIRLVLARRGGAVVAAAYFLVGDDCLFGRYWGCAEDIPGLHFEACYHQGIEFCIERGLSRFEPGAQGEHKISRGFLPTPTVSYHWIAEPGFRRPIARFLEYERALVENHSRRLMERSPYRYADVQHPGP